MFFRYRFFYILWESGEYTQIQKKMSFWSLLGALWEPSGHFWKTFGDQGAPKVPKSVPKAIQRLQGSPKRLRKDDMARLPQEVWRFFNNFLIFSHISFCLAPIGVYWLLLAPLGSYWLLLPPIASYWLLMAPITPVVCYWILLAPIGSYWLLLPSIVSYCLLAAPIGS